MKRRAALGWLLAVLLATPRCVVAQPEETPPGAASATLTLTAHSAGLGMGLVWGAGTLEFRGQRYPVRLDGFAIGAGAAAMAVQGRVFHLNDVEDLNGSYSGVGAGADVGRGTARLRLRNAKGVVIDLRAEAKGIQVGIGPRGVALQVGSAGGPPLSAAFALPQSLGFGEAAFGALALQPTLNLQFAGFAQGNAGFGGEWDAGPIASSDLSMQHSNEIGLNAAFDLRDYGSVQGRVSGIFSLSAGGVDPGATSYPDFNTNSYSIEAASLAWRSGKTLPGLGYDAVQIAYGNQNYQVFDGLLFWDGGADCGVRGACWLSPRKAFHEAGTLRLDLGAWLLEGFHLKANDNPTTNTRLGGGRVEYTFKDRLVKDMKSGFLYFNIHESEEPTRDGMNGFYFYQEATPSPHLEDLQYTASFVAQTNSAVNGNDQAYGWYVAPAYTVSPWPWSPQLSYRFASFSGGGTRNFDPLFTGLSDWGYWFQGELLGEWVLSNSNLQSHMVRLKLQPSDVFTLNLFYYKFLLANSEQSFGAATTRVDSRQLADEIDAILDVALTNWWTMTAELTLAVPNAGFREATGGNSTWISSMLYSNFNF